MKKSLFGFNMVAAAVLMSGMVPVTWAVAQTAYPPRAYPLPPGSFNPTTARRTVTLAPQFGMCGSAAGGAVMMGPCQGPVGTPIRIQLSQNLGAVPALLSFKAVVSRGVPARVHSRLLGGGASFNTPAPAQLCIQGGGTWEAELVLSNGRNLGVVGSFTPTNCP